VLDRGLPIAVHDFGRKSFHQLFQEK
jgi:hypothetical protein